jgi:hypothetical protein
VSANDRLDRARARQLPWVSPRIGPGFQKVHCYAGLALTSRRAAESTSGVTAPT